MGHFNCDGIVLAKPDSFDSLALVVELLSDDQSTRV